MDFNVSSKSKQETFRMMTKTGTVAFSAPEIFTQQVYNEKVDIWSAGTVLYMMLCGHQPFDNENMAQLVKQITSDEPDITAEGFLDVSSEAIDLLERMLNKDPDQRPSATECLKSSWFRPQVNNNL
jgi:serine/threonine protein kinase